MKKVILLWFWAGLPFTSMNHTGGFLYGHKVLQKGTQEKSVRKVLIQAYYLAYSRHLVTSVEPFIRQTNNSFNKQILSS